MKPTTCICTSITAAKPEVNNENNSTRWIRFTGIDGTEHIRCPECNQFWAIAGHATKFKFCFNCGESMIKTDEAMGGM